MIKTISKILFCALLTSGLQVRANELYDFIAEAKKYHAYENVISALSVVEVHASVKGSGLLVFKDGKLIIVTNSHNLQGKKSALITLPERYVNHYLNERYIPNDGILGFQGMAQVLYDFPLSDIAILSFPEEKLTEEQRFVIEKYALANGVFTEKDGWVPGVSSSLNHEAVTAVLQGKPTTIEASRNAKGSLIKDTFISGDESLIWAAPIYAKPGVSGGGYYKEGILVGLVTKISLAGEAVTLATPFSKIASLLYSPNKNETQVFWKDGLMVYKAKDKTITINPLGNGWLGNGGDLEEVDESKSGDSNPNYWRLQARGSYSTQSISTWDPFVYRPGHFVVNKENVSFVRVKKKSLFKSLDTYRIPTLAQFIASENKGEEQVFLQNTPQNLQILKEARIAQKTNINHGRVYVFSKYSNLFKIETPQGKGEEFPTERSARYRDPEGYLMTYYESYETKFSDKTIFDVKLRPNETDYSRQFSVTAATDLSKVVIKKFEVGYNSSKLISEIVLKPQELNSPQSLVFKSDDGVHKAILMYSNTDLSKLVKVFVLSEKVLAEFWTDKN
jgi:hypothetical protein